MTKQWKKLSIVTIAVFALFLFTNFHTSNINSQTDHIVISEVQIDGASSTDEFVELYNPLSEDVDLSGWRLRRSTSSGNESTLVTSLSGTIAAYSYYLIAHADYDGEVTPDENYSTGSSIAVNNSVSLYSDGGDTLVDRVGMGEGEGLLVEEEATIVPDNDQSIERKAQSSSTPESMGMSGIDELLGNGHDSNNNAEDFLLRMISEPQNSSHTENPSLTTPTPTAELSLTPTPEPTSTPSSTPTVTQTPTPTNEPTNMPTPTAVEPTPTQIPEPTSQPEPTPYTRTIGVFSFPGFTKICQLQYQPRNFRFFTLLIPHLNCFNI